MASRYSKIFSLRDIFNDTSLEGKLPLINYKEIQRDNGKIGYRTRGKTVTAQVFSIAKSSARPHYSKFNAVRGGDIITISGDIRTSLTAVYNSVLLALQSSKMLLGFISNNADIISSALKEAEKNKRTYGFTSKLSLRVQSKEEMRGMTKYQLMDMMNNIMEDIMFSGNYPNTVKKYGIVERMGQMEFDRLQANWQRRVGE